MGIILNIRQWTINKNRLSKAESEKLGVSLAYLLGGSESAVGDFENDAEGAAQTVIDNRDRYNKSNLKTHVNPNFYEIKVLTPSQSLSPTPLCLLSSSLWGSSRG
jgi:hypothetical protein